jgi:nucleoside 2-deoxyribosyltransferase
MREIKVYLAGGFHSGWQDLVKARTSNLRFFDPREYKLDAAELYTAWDLNAIRESDWVFAYLEKSNPGGYALALEIGFAKALGKKILLIDERSIESEMEARRFAMLHICADACFDSLDAGIAFFREATQTMETLPQDPY